MFLDELYLENENTGLEEEEVQFCEGVDGLFEIALESEMSWNNLVMDTVKEEFVAIKNESSILLEEAKKGFFSNVIAWIKKKAQQIADFFKKLFERLRSYFLSVDKFVERYGDKINNFKGKVKVKIYKWKSGQEVSNTIDQLHDVSTSILELAEKTTEKEQSTDDLVKAIFGAGVSYSGINKTVLGKIREEKPEVVTVDDAIVKKVFKELKNKQSIIKSLEKTRNETLNKLKIMKYTAERGMSLLNKEDDSKEIQKVKINIKNLKNAHSVADRLLGLQITIGNQMLADHLKICRAAIGGGVKEKKETKSESANLFALI